MKTTIKHTKGCIVGRYTLIERIGSGGNGEVWIAHNEEDTRVAIKLLKNIKEKDRCRFRDEIDVVIKNLDIDGILPILDHYCPEGSITDTPYYIMPLAEPLTQILETKKSREVIEYMSQVCQTLVKLHERGIAHRDIKPANLLFFNGRICLNDFGLVKFPGKQDITEKNENVGPKWTMAPEMRRDATHADGLKADSYSFAKTLWILLTKNSQGFDGQYFPDTILALSKYISILYSKGLDDLLMDCTNNEPDQRPNMKEISNRLSEWFKIEIDHEARNKLQWKDVLKEIFPSGTPTRAIWEQIDAIISIMLRLSATDDLNHMFLPSGGGMDLLDIRRSRETQCIELDVGGTIIVKPKRLVFESFHFKEEWNYFRLETDNLAPSGYYDEVGDREFLTEVAPLIYTDALCGKFNDYNGKDLPDNAREIERVLVECSFVIFQNFSTYNIAGKTYDARHNKMSTDEFRAYIANIVRQISGKENKNLHKTNTITLVKPSSFKSKRRLLTCEEIALLREVAALAKECQIEELELSEKFGMGTQFDLFNDAFISAPRPKSNGLKEYLKNLSQVQIVLITAVMYGGRDGILPSWGEPLDELCMYFQNHTDLIRLICGKTPLADYIERGITIYT